MTMFTAIEGGLVLLTNRGTYQEARLYKRENELFAQVKTGFTRLLAAGLTTTPGIKWKAIEGLAHVDTPFGPREIEEPSAEDKAAMAAGKRVRARMKAAA